MLKKNHTKLRSKHKNNLSVFNRSIGEVKEQEQVMPVLFIGHGSRMNGIEDTQF